jgi:hypothetical protein
MRRMVGSAAVGTVTSFAFALLVYLLAPKTDVGGAYLAPGLAIGGALSPFMPTRLVYWLAPEGGPEAFLIVVNACSFMFWTLAFAVFYRVAFQKPREAL